MYLPRTNKISAWIITLKSSYRYLLTFFFLCTLVCIWLFALYFRLKETIALQYTQIKYAHEQKLKIKQTQDSYIGLSTKVKELQSEIDVFKGKNTEQELQSAMLFLINQAQQSNIVMQSCSVDHQIDKEWYVEHIVNINLSGSYEKLINFLNACYESDYLFLTKQFSMHRSENTFNLKAHLNIMAIK